MPEVWSLLAPQKKLSANFCWGGFQNHIHQKLAEKSFSKCRPLFLLSNVKALKTVKRCDSPHKLWSLPCWKEAISQYKWRQVIFFRVNIAGYTLRMICGLVSEWVFADDPRWVQRNYDPPRDDFAGEGSISKVYSRFIHRLYFFVALMFLFGKKRCGALATSLAKHESRVLGVHHGILMYNVQRDPYICNHKW